MAMSDNGHAGARERWRFEHGRNGHIRPHRNVWRGVVFQIHDVLSISLNDPRGAVQRISLIDDAHLRYNVSVWPFNVSQQKVAAPNDLQQHRQGPGIAGTVPDPHWVDMG